MPDSLEAIYAAIPPVTGCRKGCSDCCGPIPLGRMEVARVNHPTPPLRSHPKLPESTKIWSTPANACGGCAYSTTEGCGIYDQRPFVCRLFAAVEDQADLTCPHGAKAERPLTRAKADALGMRYMHLIHGGELP